MATDCEMSEVSSDEIELSLELSIGGRYGKPKSAEQKSMDYCIKKGADLTEDGRSVLIDPRRKREIQALWRQEGRKKREEKLKNVSISNCFAADEACLGAGEYEGRVVGDREMMREKEDVLVGEPPRKKRRNEDFHEIKDLSIELNRGSGPAATKGGNEKLEEENVFEAGDLRILWSSNDDGTDSGGNGKALSLGGYSSSAASDYQSSSRQGGSSSDARSNSSLSQPEQQLNASAATNLLEQSEHGGSSNPIKSNEAIDKAASFNGYAVSSSIPQISRPKPSKGNESGTPPNPPLNKPNSTTGNLTPAKPQTENNGNATFCLPHMPCVSATGNGPNGKTITGFLYRYTKTDVNIMCVCHGNSFSPAEFVEHAGGIDIAHPLRHITVVPSAFG